MYTEDRAIAIAMFVMTFSRSANYLINITVINTWKYIKTDPVLCTVDCNLSFDIPLINYIICILNDRLYYQTCQHFKIYFIF